MKVVWIMTVCALGFHQCTGTTDISTSTSTLTADQNSCIYEFHNFEEKVMSVKNFHSMLERAFYQPNNQFPYAVVVRYSTVTANSSRHYLSTDPTCRNQIWSWNSASVFSIAKPTNANIYSLYTLNYFRPLHIPHVDIVVPLPCPNATFRLLSRMTSLLHKYASNEEEMRLGYTEMGCGTQENDTMFHFPYEGSQHDIEEYFLYIIANFLPLTMCIAVNLFAGLIAKPKAVKFMKQNYSPLESSPEGSENLSYSAYGLPWGIITSATILTVIIFAIDIYTTATVLPAYKGIIVAYFPVVSFMFTPVIPTLLPTLYIWKSIAKMNWPIPYIYHLPATLICRGSKEKGRKLVIGVAIYVMIVMSCLIGMHGLAIVISSIASLHAVGMSSTIMVLVAISVTDIFALLFTAGAYCSTKPQYRKPTDKKIMINTIILIPVLFTVILTCTLPLSCCNSAGVESSQNRFLTTIGSLPSPIIGFMVVIGQRKLITYAMQPKRSSTDGNSSGKETTEKPKTMPRKSHPVEVSLEDDPATAKTGNIMSHNHSQIYAKTIFLQETLL